MIYMLPVMEVRYGYQAPRLSKEGISMAWTEKMAFEERNLENIRLEINALYGDDEATRAKRSRLMNRLRGETRGMRSFLDDCLCGRNESEKSLMLCRVRLEFPLFYHLDSSMRLFPDDRAVSAPGHCGKHGRN